MAKVILRAVGDILLRPKDCKQSPFVFVEEFFLKR